MRLTNTMRDTFISNAMRDVPGVNFKEQIHAAALKAAREKLPPKIRAAYDDSACRPFIETTSFHVGGEYVTYPGLYADREDIKKACATLISAAEAQETRDKDLRNKLRSIAYACQTRKALAEALPEFEKYLPADESAANRQMPVVTGVVVAFVNAGWPKDQRKQRKAA